jgi:tetratricopeptide (TPR) repeat protein
MQGAKIPQEQRQIIIPPSEVEIVICDDQMSHLALVLPPIEDLSAIAAIHNTQYSIKEMADNLWHETRDFYIAQYDLLKNKNEEFKSSPTYLNRLANWANLAEMHAEEAYYLIEAQKISKNTFFQHRLGVNLINQHKNVEAELIFNGLDLESDIQANLRLAYFAMQRHDVHKATNLVDKALIIDPIDFGARLFDGALKLLTGRYKEAVQSFRIAEEDRPNSSALHKNKAVAYLYLGLIEKAFTSLKRSISIDPLNKNAILLLADLAFSERRSVEAIPGLQFYLKYEQKDPNVWSRLARGFLAEGNMEETIKALRKQASLENSVSVWNNFGLTYYRANNKQKAYEAFKYALTENLLKDEKSYFYAARNMSILLAEDRKFKEALVVTKSLIEEDVNKTILSDDLLSDIYSVYVFSLSKESSIETAIALSDRLLRTEESSKNLKAWLLGTLISYNSLMNNFDITMSLIKEFDHVIKEFDTYYPATRDSLINTLAFAFAESGDTKMAEYYLSNIKNTLLKDPYPTATLGLINIRKGEVEKGTLLYERAIGLSLNNSDKIRIRQKLNLELGRLALLENKKQALRYFNKVINTIDGSKELVNLGKNIISKNLLASK